MLNSSSKKTRATILQKFTKELIKNSGTEIISQLRNILEEKRRLEVERLEKIRKQNVEFIKERAAFGQKTSLEEVKMPLQKEDLKIEIPRKQIIIKPVPTSLIIPEVNLPERLRYIKPFPTNKRPDLGKINGLLRDPNVKSIECHGPNKEIMVRTEKLLKTNIILTDEEVDAIVQKFAMESNIPANDGLYKVSVGDLLLTAIVSETVGTKFIIRKLMFREMQENFG